MADHPVAGPVDDDPILVDDGSAAALSEDNADSGGGSEAGLHAGVDAGVDAGSALRRALPAVALAVCVVGGAMLVLAGPTGGGPVGSGRYPMWDGYRRSVPPSEVAACLLTWSLDVDLVSGAGTPLLSGDDEVRRFAVWREDAVRWSGGLGPGLDVLDRLAEADGDSTASTRSTGRNRPVVDAALAELAEIDRSDPSAVQVDVGPAIVAARAAFEEAALDGPGCPLAPGSPRSGIGDALAAVRDGPVDGPIRATRCVEGEVVALLAAGPEPLPTMVEPALALLASRRAEDPTDGGARGVPDEELARILEAGAGPGFVETWDDHRHDRSDLIAECPVAEPR